VFGVRQKGRKRRVETLWGWYVRTFKVLAKKAEEEDGGEALCKV